MDEKLYSVSEAVRLIGVESHVLRYWEEELSIPIQRTSLGHRTYSEKDIETFRQVKDWKQKGIQLKAIRLLLAEKPAMESALHTVAYREAEYATGEEPVQMRSGTENCEAAETVRTENSGKEKLQAEKTESESIRIENKRSETGCKKYSDSDLRGNDKSEEKNHTEDKSRENINEEQRELLYEIISTEEPQDDMEKAIQLLKQMMEEVVGEQNKKLEEQLIEQLRDEMELLYLQYLQAMQEAAASREKEHGGIKQIFRRLFPGRK